MGAKPTIPFALLEEYAQKGHGINSIARLVGRSPHTIRARFEAAHWTRDAEGKLTPPSPENVVTIKHYESPIPLADIIAYKKKGLTNEEIGKLTNRSAETISRRVNEAGYNKNSVKNFRTNKAEYMEFQESRLLDLNERDINMMTPKDRIVSAAILEDKIRLIRGQPTEITDVRVLQDNLKEIDNQMNKLQKELEDAKVIDMTKKEDNIYASSIRETTGNDGNSGARAPETIQEKSGSFIDGSQTTP